MADDTDMPSRPPSPTSRPGTPGLFSSGIGNGSSSMGFFSAPFERFVRDETSDWAHAFTLLDTIETFFDSRMDLLERRLKKQTDKIKMRAEEAFKLKSPSGEVLRAKDIEKELQKFKFKVGTQLADKVQMEELINAFAQISTRMQSLSTAWQSAKVVRTREKIAFFFGVMSLLGTALLYGMAPEWIHISYSVQSLYLLPWRWYTYKKRAWHYFLFDLCYYATILNFIYIWIVPSSTTLWIACYALSHGSLASAVITWRNSLVFHDWDKVTSLFIHIYPPLVFTVLRHRYPDVATRFPAVAQVQHLEPIKTFILSGLIYAIWQGLYWKFVLIDRRKKIESGERTTSFSWLLNDKRGVIGRMLSRVPKSYREASFMTGQLMYGLITELPVFVLYNSSFWSGVFLIFIFGVSAWNGGGFYIEVFGRKFERELEALRKELAEAGVPRSSVATPTTSQDGLHLDSSPPSHTRTSSEGSVSDATESPVFVAQDIAHFDSTPVEGLGLDTGGEPPEHLIKKNQ